MFQDIVQQVKAVRHTLFDAALRPKLSSKEHEAVYSSSFSELGKVQNGLLYVAGELAQVGTCHLEKCMALRNCSLPFLQHSPGTLWSGVFHDLKLC